MLHAVGEELQRARLSRKLKPTDVERLGGPSYKTVQAIEEGEAGHIESLDKCARALDLSIIDVLYSVLSRRETPLSPEAALIVPEIQRDDDPRAPGPPGDGNRTGAGPVDAR